MEELQIHQDVKKKLTIFIEEKKGFEIIIVHLPYKLFPSNNEDFQKSRKFFP